MSCTPDDYRAFQAYAHQVKAKNDYLGFRSLVHLLLTHDFPVSIARMDAGGYSVVLALDGVYGDPADAMDILYCWEDLLTEIRHRLEHHRDAA